MADLDPVLSAEQALYSADWLRSSATHNKGDKPENFDDQLDLYPELEQQDQSIEYQNKIDVMKRTMNLKCKGKVNLHRSVRIHITRFFRKIFPSEFVFISY